MQKLQEEQWRMEREAKMLDRIFALEERVDKLEGKETYSTLTPVR